MSRDPIRVLVVDDHATWRTAIRGALNRVPGVHVIAEAADGAEAVTLAHEQSPDLVLLDVGLPGISGIEAAERISARTPTARILFASNYGEYDIIDAAFRSGARGYMMKAFAAHELQPAVEAVASGRWFVSPARGGRALASSPRDPHVHRAVFYASLDARLDDYAKFIAEALGNGRVVLGCVDNPCRDPLRSRLAALGVVLDKEIAAGRITALDTELLVPQLLEGDRISDGKFFAAAIPLLLNAARRSRTPQPAMSAFGDASYSLWRAGEVDAAIRLEQLWDEMSGVFNLELLCGYDIDAGQSARADCLVAIHSHASRRY
jgi:two-component system nitrate/nitrite response regulator NarL